MTEEEQAICQVVETWLAASRKGDTATVIGLPIRPLALCGVEGSSQIGNQIVGMFNPDRQADR